MIIVPLSGMVAGIPNEILFGYVLPGAATEFAICYAAVAIFLLILQVRENKAGPIPHHYS